MKKEDFEELNKTINSMIKLREQEKEKYQVSEILHTSILILKSCISSLEQLKIRGEKIDSTRQNNLKNLRNLMANLTEIKRLLGMGGRSP
mgnify:CR=1 FL=1